MYHACRVAYGKDVFYTLLIQVFVLALEVVYTTLFGPCQEPSSI